MYRTISIGFACVAALFWVCVGFAGGGPTEDSDDKREPVLDTGLELIQAELITSYVTGGGGINFGDGHGAFGDLLIEADLNHHLELWKNGNWLVMVNPRTRLRLRTDASSPVRTPSFMPRITGFYCFGRCADALRRDDRGSVSFKYLSLTVSHHSNGQAGSFYAENDIVASEDERVSAGEVNTIDGSFSTNFVELDMTRVASKGVLPTSIQVWGRWHPLNIGRADELDEQYERVSVGMSFRSNTIRTGWIPAAVRRRAKGWLAKTSGSIGYVLAGREFVVKANPQAPQIAEVKARWHDNVNLELTLSIKPKFLEHVSTFLKYDFGYDYYNMNFQKRLNRLQFGIGADPFWKFD